MDYAKPTLLSINGKESRFRTEKKFVIQILHNSESLVHFLT